MVIRPISNIPKYDDNDDSLFGNTQKPVIQNPSSIIGNLPSIPKVDQPSSLKQTPPYTLLFSSIDWQEIIVDYKYEILILAEVHKKGKDPFALVYEDHNGDFIQVLPDEILISNTGDVTIQSSTPISGKIIVYS